MQEKIVTGKDIAEKLKDVKHKIVVTSGKGGVGKSTIAALLAVHYARQGKSVGVFDADFLGPSIPRLFGIERKAQELTIGTKGINPVYTDRYGIKVLSIQFMLPRRESPVIWRGLAINTAIRSFLGSVDWGELDYLIFDMPPGTGDAILTVMDFVELDGLIMVTIPQDLSALIVEKAINMARKMDTDVLGIVENMSYFECPKCGEKIYLFGKDKAIELCKKYDVDLIAQIPFDRELLDYSDRGRIEDFPCDYFEHFYY